MAIDHAEAEFDATTHVTKRTLLSDEAVQRICEAYLEARAELARLKSQAKPKAKPQPLSNWPARVSKPRSLQKRTKSK